MATIVEEFVNEDTGLRWGYTSAGYVWCEDCGGKVTRTCTACHGESGHWCERDALAARTSNLALYCTEWDGPECDVCENTGTEGCRTCDG